MSWHVLHVLSPNTKLSKFRGHLRCEQVGQPPRQIPLEDLKCVILAYQGIALSSNVISALLEHKVGIIHCDQKFVPCGVTMPLVQTIDPLIQKRQITAKRINQALWQKILHQKISNQAKVLELIGADYEVLKAEAKKKLLNESAAARQYFRFFFTALNEPYLTRREDNDHELNVLMNYGYTVLQAMIHRSVVVHGLSLQFGIHHVDRYQAHAFVYDLMEPWRPFVDLLVWTFIQRAQTADLADFKNFIHHTAFGWTALTLQTCRGSQKMLNCIDHAIASVQTVYQCQKIKPLWLPKVETKHLMDLLKWDGVL